MTIATDTNLNGEINWSGMQALHLLRRETIQARQNAKDLRAAFQKRASECDPTCKALYRDLAAACRGQIEAHNYTLQNLSAFFSTGD